MFPFSNLAFSSEEVALICSALESFQNMKFDFVSRRQHRDNVTFAASALEKLESEETQFSPNELRVIYASLELFSQQFQDSEEVFGLEDLPLGIEGYAYTTKIASQKIRALLAQSGIMLP